ncbi:bifunctional indole-3-glycerol-phosphate synthase TrpC/phosphoribosylanthranilate isomerase TrpF [Parashewanella tropica]|uniref:bifunctional indole-3-glycerol-phosphate synthase TrpC/phosphoribosylanthranilate isomerase TrpF n=1 Tax=Parashewanella tropica TaxID=2547970 RepID=UPI00105A0CBB|nr:bifunctional indole-3-glycerol-phosphate synthase TrpC/phosphoribosylanthranilate isomerase TrpF [Parashewanella tropica]
MSTILQTIVATKVEHIEQLKVRYPEEQLQPKISLKSLYDTLKEEPTGFIFECKKASPSKGLIREDFHLGEICSIYRRYASAISVLTDEQFFQGSFENLAIVRKLVNQPILCKDFIVDGYQIKLAAHHGADAILLMLSVLGDEQYQALATIAKQYQLDILTEVSNEEELQRAINLDAAIIGINNRNLRDLSTDLDTTRKLAPLIGKDKIIVSESGIYTNQQVKQLAPLVNGFLVGSSLMAEGDLDLACRQLVYGNNKVCGITRIEDSSAAANAGATHIGFIFTPKSPRYVSPETAASITEHHRHAQRGLNFVGVFVDQSIDDIVSLSHRLGLHSVQLHGKESTDFIQQLKARFTISGLSTKVTKAVAVDENNQVHFVVNNSDRLLLDTKSQDQFGGTGDAFDWTMPIDSKSSTWLAGGLSPKNATEAMNQGFYGLDFNSGLEASAGIKDAEKIQQVFTLLRNY